MNKSHNILLLIILLLATHLRVAGQEEYTEKLADSLKREAYKTLYTNPQKTVDICDEACAIKAIPATYRGEFCYFRAQAYQLTGDYGAAITKLFDAESHYDDAAIPPLDRRRADLYDLLSVCYTSLEDLSTAYHYNNKATTIYEAIADSASIAAVYNNRGIIHAYAENIAMADSAFNYALQINRRLKDLNAIATNLNNLCIYDGNTERQLKYISESIIINTNLGKTWGMAENYNNLGRIYIHAGQYADARQALQKARQLAESINAQGLILDNHEYTSLMYQAKGDYPNAYRHLKAYSELESQLSSANKLYIVEKEIAGNRLRKQIEKSRRNEEWYRMKLYNSMLISAVVIIILIFLICIIFNRRKKRKVQYKLLEKTAQLEKAAREAEQLKRARQDIQLRETEKELHYTRSEITDMAVFMHSRNQALDKIREMIKKGYTMNDKELHQHLKQITMFIRHCQTSDNNNEILLRAIDEHSREFTDRLLSAHPSLTQGEQHLAILLRADITTKDIAILTGTTAKSVTMNRYRLRKALNLEPDDNLVKYLQKI